MSRPFTSIAPTRVVAVAPAFNRATLTERGVRSLSKVKGLAGCVIVDHWGKDDTALRATAAWDGCKVIRASRDLWWTGAVNVGLEYAFSHGATHVVIVNDDQEFDPDFVNALLDVWHRDPNTLVGAKILDATDHTRIVSYGATVDFEKGHVQQTAAGATDDGRFDHEQETQWLPTQGVLLGRGLYDRIGPLDAVRFPHYFGDVHLGFRAREVGARVVVCGAAKTFVDPATTGTMRADEPLTLKRGVEAFTSRRSWANVRDHLVFALRHAPTLKIPSYLHGHLTRTGRRVIRQAVLRNAAFARAERLLKRARARGHQHVAVYGSGWDTTWLFQERPDTRALVDFLVDDRRAGEKHPSGLDVVDLQTALSRGVQTVIINCAAHEETMWTQLKAHAPKHVTIKRLYSPLPI